MREDHFVMYKRENGIWCYYVYRFGKKVRRSTGERRKGRAYAIAEERAALGDLLCLLERTLPKTFAEFSEPFWNFDTCPILQDKIARGGHFSKGLAKTNRLNVQKYLIPVFGKKYLPEITPAMVNRWLLSVPEKHKVTPQTANKQLTMLRQMLDVAVSENLISENPARKVKPLIPKKTAKGCFTRDQIKSIFSEPWHNSIVELACRLASITGLRMGEIRALQRDQLTEDSINVTRAFSNTDKLKCTKTGKSRIVPVPHTLFEELLRVPTDGPYIFSLCPGIPVHSDTLRDALYARMEAVGIDYKKERLSFHSFRHFFNTRLKAAGVDGEMTRAVIGHSSEDMTEHYLHLSAEDLGRIRIIQEGL